jgi:site-specific recombinase XerD
MGIDPKVVQGWLGHKSVNVTLDIYTQISQEKEQQQIQKINNLTPKLIS